MAAFETLNAALVDLQESLETMGTAAQMLGQNRQATLETIEAAKALVTRLDTFLGQSEHLSNGIGGLIAQIESVNFPKHFETLNSTMLAMGDTVRSLLAHQEEFERTKGELLLQRLQELKEQIAGLEKTAESVAVKQEASEKRITDEQRKHQGEMRQLMGGLQTSMDGLGEKIASSERNILELVRVRIDDTKRDIVSATNSGFMTLQRNLDETLEDNLKAVRSEIIRNRGLTFLSMGLLLIVLGIQLFYR